MSLEISSQICMDVPSDTPLAALVLIFFKRYSVFPWTTKAVHFKATWNPDFASHSLAGGRHGEMVILAPISPGEWFTQADFRVVDLSQLWSGLHR